MRTWGKQRGQTLIEYALLIAFIAIIAIAILTVLGRKTRDVFVTVESSLVTSSESTYGQPPPAPWWQPYLMGRYQQYLAGGESPQSAFNRAMADLAGEASRQGLGFREMRGLAGEATQWFAGQMDGP